MSEPIKFLIPSEMYLPFTGWLKFNSVEATEETLYRYWLEFIEIKRQAGEE